MVASETSRMAYRDIPNLGQRQMEVYKVIENKKKICNLQIAYELQKPINQITPRTNELVKMGLVHRVDILPNPITGKKVNYWGLRNERDY